MLSVRLTTVHADNCLQGCRLFRGYGAGLLPWHQEGRVWVTLNKPPMLVSGAMFTFLKARQLLARALRDLMLKYREQLDRSTASWPLKHLPEVLATCILRTTVSQAI